jgi:SPP1 gp7 family putative phage head morphogenesis protein
MNAADIIADRLIQRGIYLERYKAGFNNRILAELEKLEDELTRELASTFGKPTTNPAYRRQKLERLLADTRSVIKQTYAGTKRLSAREMLRLAANEQKYAVEAYAAATGINILSDLNYDELKKLTDDTLIYGAKSSEWWDRQSDDLQRRFGDQMRQGVLRGETLDQLTGRVRGTQARVFTDGVMPATKRQAEALVRTSVQTVANATRDEFYKANSDVVNAIQWIATLDSRTTHICMALSGKMWTTESRKPIGHSLEYPGPTAHWNCRSTQVAVLKKWEDLVAKQDEAELDEEFRRQLKAQGFDDAAIAQIKRNTRASMDGQIAKDISFDEWLKSKPPEFQDQMLGKGKGKLFRDGKITLTDLVDQRLRPLTIEELETLPKPRPGHEPIDLPLKRPNRHVRDTERSEVPPGDFPSAKASPPLVVHADVTPRKAPVSETIMVAPEALRAPSYEATLRVIDKVHDDGGLTAIPLRETKATVNVGGYSWRSKTGASIDIEVSRAGRFPELTLVHEVGHFIDHQALGTRGEFASEKAALLEVWRKIVLATPTAKKLKLGAAGRKIDGEWPRRPPSEFAEALRLRELWARAYTQYVVRHGANTALQAQFEVAAQRLMALSFWPDDEFEAIDLAIATILAAKSWPTQP